ncbi:MAG: 3'-5' exonuclease, partial [bacterium]
QVLDKGDTVSRAVCFGDIAILSRSHEGVKGIAAALGTQGLPVATTQPGLLATPEATLALACLRRLNDPGDTIATAEIVSLADGLEPEVWVAQRLRYLQAGGNADGWLEAPGNGEASHPILITIAELRRNLPVLAPREALHTVIASCDLPAKVVRWSRDPDLARVRLANLEALLDLAAQYEDLCRGGQHAASISGLILFLGELATEGLDLQAEPAIDAVKVMTHHAAKGLEWPVVVLTDLAANIKDRLWSISAHPDGTFNAHKPLDNRFIRFWPWPFGAQKKVGIADAIALTPIAAQFRTSAVEEAKRLLYVSMTRARDLMVLVRADKKLSGEWIDCLEAPWLLQESGHEEVILPSGEFLSAVRWDIDPVDDAGQGSRKSEAPLHWFPATADTGRRLPLNFTPSSAADASTNVLEKCVVGERIPVREGTDMGTLGSAIHACLALSFTDPAHPLVIDDIERILQSFGVADCVPSNGVLRQSRALQEWIANRWPGATASAEYPVQEILDSAQILN